MRHVKSKLLPYSDLLKTLYERTFFVIILLTLLGCTKTTELQFVEPWIREAPPNATVLAGYVEIKNKSNAQHILVKAESDDFGHIEFHETKIINGVASMIMQSELPIPANSSLKLEPSGLHLMLMQPKRAITSGSQVNIKLVFADGKVTTVVFAVKNDFIIKA